MAPGLPIKRDRGVKGDLIDPGRGLILAVIVFKGGPELYDNFSDYVLSLVYILAICICNLIDYTFV